MVHLNTGLIVEGMFKDQEHRRYSQIAAEKRAALPVNPTEDKLSPEAMSVSFSRIADEALFAAEVAIEKASEALDD